MSERQIDHSTSAETASDDDTPQNLAAWQVYAYKDPRERAPQLSVNATHQVGKTPNCSTVMGAGISTKVTVSDRPGQAANSSTDYFVEGWGGLQPRVADADLERLPDLTVGPGLRGRRQSDRRRPHGVLVLGEQLSEVLAESGNDRLAAVASVQCYQLHKAQNHRAGTHDERLRVDANRTIVVIRKELDRLDLV